MIIMGLIYYYCDNGGGKTTSALGVALRALGQGKEVAIIQFLKWYQTGEVKFSHPLYHIHQFSPEGWKSRGELKKEDSVFIELGLRLAETYLKRSIPIDVLILDEISLAIKEKLIHPTDVLRILKMIPKETTVILTGREEIKELVELADIVNRIVEVKVPSNMPLDEGIQY